MAELDVRLGWVELQYWIAFYTVEAEQSLPKDQRPVRVRKPDEAAAVLDSIF